MPETISITQIGSTYGTDGWAITGICVNGVNYVRAARSPSPAADRILALQDQIRDGALTLADALKEIGAPEPVANAQKPTLVDRVADAIAAVDDEGLTNMTWSSHAQAAIRVVAEWVRENPGPNSAWAAVARDLMDEASR